MQRSAGIALVASLLPLPAVAHTGARNRPEPPGRAVEIAGAGAAAGDAVPLRRGLPPCECG